MKVAALFVMKDSIYKTLPEVDCYDADRNALTFDGGCPVVAHPPCRSWGSLKAFATAAPPGEHEMAIWAVEQVRRCGGVLEHPKGSGLWKATGLPEPGMFPDEYGGYTIQVDQFHWGHKARKRTWLYIVGCPYSQLPARPKRAGKPAHCIGTSRQVGRLLKYVTKKERSATPIEFAKWLVAVARLTLRMSGFSPLDPFVGKGGQIV